VYQVYGLTEGEIAIVERAVRVWTAKDAKWREKSAKLHQRLS